MRLDQKINDSCHKGCRNFTTEAYPTTIRYFYNTSLCLLFRGGLTNSSYNTNGHLALRQKPSIDLLLTIAHILLNTMEHTRDSGSTSNPDSRETVPQNRAEQTGNSETSSPHQQLRTKVSKPKSKEKKTGVVWHDFDLEKPPVIDSAWESA